MKNEFFLTNDEYEEYVSKKKIEFIPFEDSNWNKTKIISSNLKTRIARPISSVND